MRRGQKVSYVSAFIFKKFFLKNQKIWYQIASWHIEYSKERNRRGDPPRGVSVYENDQ